MKNHVSSIAYWFPISIVNCYWMILIGIDFDWLTNLLIAFTRGTISSEPGILYYIVLYYSILYCIILYCLYILSVNCVLNVWKWICIATNWELDNLWYTYMVAVYTYIGARHTQSVEIDHRTTNQSIKTYRCWLVNWYQLASANWWSIDSQIRLSADYVNCHWLLLITFTFSFSNWWKPKSQNPVSSIAHQFPIIDWLPSIDVDWFWFWLIDKFIDKFAYAGCMLWLTYIHTMYCTFWW